MDWHRAEQEETTRVLASVRERDGGGLFASPATVVLRKVLTFYPDCFLYRVVNYSAMPSFGFEYVGKGAELFYLDGTANTIFAVNDAAPLSLNRNNVVDYLDFFLSHVQGEDGEVMLVRDAIKTPGYASFTNDQKKAVIESFQPLAISFDQERLTYAMRCTLYYAGTLMSALAAIRQDGHIEFHDQAMLVQGLIPTAVYAYA